MNGVATGCCQPCALKPERHLSRNIQEKKRLTGWWHPVVAAESRRRISAAGRRSYAANVNATFYERICQPVATRLGRKLVRNGG